MESMNEQDGTLIHISHRHPLRLTDLTVTGDDAPPPDCHACRCECTGPAVYQCAPCSYVLHPSCARQRRTIRHPSHPQHDLALRLAPAAEFGCHLCRACRSISYSWFFRCEECGDFDLHLPCAALPGAAAAAHRHELRLVCEDPRRGMGSFDFCVVCRKGYSTAVWFYACRECGVGGHVGCVVPDDMPLTLRNQYAALDEEQTAVAAAAAAQWKEDPLPESQQLEGILQELRSKFGTMQLNACGLMPLFAKACRD